MRLSALAVVGAVGLLEVLPRIASANLALALNGDASIGSLSEQLLDRPRSNAGRRKNTWDADPPTPAVNGFHYFLYNMNADGTREALDNESLTVTGIVPGPGYTITSALILLQGRGPNNAPFYTNLPISTTYDNPNNTFDYETPYYELGVIQVQFKLTNPAAAGQITLSDDTELAYAAGLNPDSRGVEHFRVFTETRTGHVDDALRGGMTALVPAAFGVGLGTFQNGYLDFGNGNMAGGPDILPAYINVAPEPASLALLATGGGLLLRRRRPN